MSSHIILPALLAFLAHSWALHVVTRADRRRPCIDSIRLVSHPWVFALVTIAAALVLESAGMHYRNAADHTWQWATITSTGGLVFAVYILAGRRGH